MTAETQQRTTTASYADLHARFAEEFDRIAEGAAAREREHLLPYGEIRRLNELGFGALRVPVAAGGWGASVETLFRLLIDLAAADASIAHQYRSHFLFAEGLAGSSAERRERWYRRIAAGEIVGNASSETSNAIGDTNTKLTQRNGRWYVDGRKYYSTGAIYADWIMVTTSIDGEPGRQFTSVNATDSGVERLDDWDGFGQQLTGTGTTIFTSVPVDPEDIIPRVDGPGEGPALAQLFLLAVIAGIGRNALHDADELVRTRKRVFNTGNGTLARRDPQILQVIGEVSGLVHAAMTLVLDAARLFDDSAEDDLESRYIQRELTVDRVHVFVPDVVMRATQKIFDVLGASSTSRGLALDRHWRNVRTIASHNPAIYKARIIGDFEVNGTLPEGMWGVGDLRGQK